MTEPDYAGATAIIVISVPEVKSRSVRVNITIPQDIYMKVSVNSG